MVLSSPLLCDLEMSQANESENSLMVFITTDARIVDADGWAFGFVSRPDLDIEIFCSEIRAD